MKWGGMSRNGLQFQFYGHERLFNFKKTFMQKKIDSKFK